MQRATAIDHKHSHIHSSDLHRSENPSNWRQYWTAKYWSAKSRLQRILAKADIAIDGVRQWDPQVRDQRLYSRVLRFGSIGLGDSYVEGWWECSDLEEFFFRILKSGLESRGESRWQHLLSRVTSWAINAQTRLRARLVAEKHYDLGNRLYQCMLDHRLVYTTAHWRHASTLDQAQEEKLHTVCETLALEPGMRLLDIGCGWGSLAGFAAANYGVTAVGITISHRQLELARERCAGLPVELCLQDYRDVEGQFDRIASLGMFEHVGTKNYRRYFQAAHRLLKPGGLFYLSTIGSPHAIHYDDPWTIKRIFPNSHVPSWPEIARAAKGLFSVENIENWGEDYGRTCLAWLANVEKNWAELKSLYDEEFRRMWRYYLLGSAAAFRTKNTECWQILLSPD